MYGFDISNYQWTIDIAKISADFVIQKATEGTNFVDGTLTNHANQVLKAGKLLGLYAFSDGKDYKQEVNLFIKAVKPYFGKATFWLDFEGNALKQGGQYARQWLEYFEKKTGHKIGIYMMLSAENSLNWSGVANHYPLWIAQYNNYYATGYSGRSLFGHLNWWKNWDIFQFSATGSLAGYSRNLDLDHARLSHADWRKMAGMKSDDDDGDDWEMTWHPRMQYDTKGHVKVNIKSGADIYSDINFTHKIAKAKYGKEFRTAKTEKGAYYVKYSGDKYAWISGEDVIVKTNPLAYNENCHDIEFQVTSNSAYTQNELNPKAKGITHLPKDSKWVVYGRKGKYLRVGSKKTGMYINADKGLIKL